MEVVRDPYQLRDPGSRSPVSYRLTVFCVRFRSIASFSCVMRRDLRSSLSLNKITLDNIIPLWYI